MSTIVRISALHTVARSWSELIKTWIHWCIRPAQINMQLSEHRESTRLNQVIPSPAPPYREPR